MEIKLSNLDPEIYNQIPLSIRLNNNDVILEELPLEIQYIINKNIVESEKNIYKPSKIFDAKCEISIYNDFVILDTKRATIIEYLKNYLAVSRGAYPFDPQFGNTLKLHLQTRDTYLRQKLLGSELNSIVNVINDSFKSDISIIISRLIPFTKEASVEYKLEIKMKIENEVSIFTVG